MRDLGIAGANLAPHWGGDRSPGRGGRGDAFGVRHPLPLQRALDVLTHDATAWPGAVDLPKGDAFFLRHPPGDRACEDTVARFLLPPRCRRSRDGLGSERDPGRQPAGRVALGVELRSDGVLRNVEIRNASSRVSPVAVLRRRRRRWAEVGKQLISRRDGLADAQQDGDWVSDRHDHSRLDEESVDDSVAVGLDVDRRLVRLHRRDHLALVDLLPDRHVPALEDPLVGVCRGARHSQIARHFRCRPSLFRSRSRVVGANPVKSPSAPRRCHRCARERRVREPSRCSARIRCRARGSQARRASRRGGAVSRRSASRP